MKAWDMSETDNATECTRQLIHVPIIHSPADMGALAGDLAAAYIERFGRRHWDEYLALLENFWQAVGVEIEGLGLDYRRVDLYQDGLPVCGKEREIVELAAAAGSQNHQLLLSLAARGATLIGTEDPKLLLEEYHNIQAAVPGRSGARGAAGPSGGPPAHTQTLARRDAYIGQRIGQLLHPGRTGVLFLGMMHHVQACLPADIVVTHLAPGAARQKDAAASSPLALDGRG
jgi:hypothetical protein